MALAQGDVITYDGSIWKNQPSVQGPFGIGVNPPTAVLHVLGSQPPAVSNQNGTWATQVVQVTGGKGGTVSSGSPFTAGTGGYVRIDGGAGGDISGSGNQAGNGANVIHQGGLHGTGSGGAVNGFDGAVLLCPDLAS